jgi:gamma-glutamyltranspeptidase/glutathione hydrolase
VAVAAGSDAWRENPPATGDDVAVARARRGMVVAEANGASKVGAQVLRSGGNAVDAAVATAFALAVVHPTAGNIGGGGFAVVRSADGHVVTLDFRETAPAAATPDMYRGKGKESSLDGHLAAGVPGSVAGLWTLHQKYGRKPWKTLVAPAISLARDGFVVDAAFAKAIANGEKRLRKNPASTALFLPGGPVPAIGSTWRAPALAATLARIAEQGAAGFYRGKTAALIVDEMQRGGGIITAADLAGYEAVWREPIVFTYRGYRAYSMPPPSSGGIALAMIAQVLEGFDLKAFGWQSREAVHVVVEAWRRAYAARNRYLGDPAFVKDMPLARLVAPEHAKGLAATIDLARATPSDKTPDVLEGEHTTPLAVVDKDGMAVSLTTTINTGFGSAVTVEGAGFLLNNEMDDFAAHPGEPNAYGLVQGEANKIEPGKRMLSSMSPTIVVDAKGAPFMILGGQGGSRIITAVFQVMSNVIDFDMDVGRAVGAARFHHQHLPDEVAFEAGAVTRAVWDGLGTMGHVRKWAKWPIATVPTLVRRGGEWTGAADPRKGGLAEGY